MNPQPYRIETERLVIRCYEPADAPLLQAATAESKAHLLPWMPWAVHDPQTIAEKGELIRRFRGQFDLDQDYVYGIFDRQESRLLGGTGLHTRAGQGGREIGYWIHIAHTGQGIATEVTSALTKVGFALLGLQWLEIKCAPDNHASAAIPKKLGYTLEATLRARPRPHDGAVRDTLLWTMLAGEYPLSPGAQQQVWAYGFTGNPLLA